jgi:hypothetical protein
MLETVALFTAIFLFYGMYTRDMVGIKMLYEGYDFFKSKYFFKAKTISHVVNFIYSLVVMLLLYIEVFPNILLITIPLLYHIVIHITVRIYEAREKKQENNK